MRLLSPLTGRLCRADLEACPGWEGAWAAAYNADAAALSAIRERARGLEVLVFVATWCPDSRREIPRFFKIIDQAGLGEVALTLIGLDLGKRDAEGLAAQWGIQAVPTFVFVRNGRELGRVVERATGTLEGDVARILATG